MPSLLKLQKDFNDQREFEHLFDQLEKQRERLDFGPGGDPTKRFDPRDPPALNALKKFQADSRLSRKGFDTEEFFQPTGRGTGEVRQQERRKRPKLQGTPTIDLIEGAPSPVDAAADFQQELRSEALSLAMRRARDIKNNFGKETEEALDRLSKSGIGKGGFRPEIDPVQKEGERTALALETLEKFDQPAAANTGLKKRRRKKDVESDVAQASGFGAVRSAVRGRQASLAGLGASERAQRQGAKDSLDSLIDSNEVLKEEFGSPFKRRSLFDQLIA